MGELLRIKPELHFPLLTVFENGDTFNKHGRFWFRDVYGDLHGPYHSKLSASLDLLKKCPTSGAPMRQPFEQDGMWWWKKDTLEGTEVMGPYENNIEADDAVRAHVEDLRDKANA